MKETIELTKLQRWVLRVTVAVIVAVMTFLVGGYIIFMFRILGD